MRQCDEYLLHTGDAQIRLLRVLIIALCLREPGKESFGRLADLLAGGEIDVLLACLSAPLSDDFFAD